MQLFATDKKVLLKAINNKGFTYCKVYANSLEKKREFNSAVKLVKLGLVVGTVSYEHSNGYQSQAFGRLWVCGKSWNNFVGSLTASGVDMANQLNSEI
ncbi:hypothetical protein L3081_24930 [Colwellia sp. MSW7]|uniref:Uncharacterized protein n=1 Tax=Colwellia maritima TaxID=2912588 RepID=A0ABS9X758_9GAMM|nr:hypothetical protein [Colwellia maritima]MCI2286070.1 hypothetical protein [Colwellia maritima]